MDFEKRVRLERGGIEESLHYGAAAVVDSSGNLLHSIGDPKRVTYPRSAIKFIRAITLAESGAAAAWNLEARHLSLACASHMGEPIHVVLVRQWLERLGLGDCDLACGEDYPMGEQARELILKSGVGRCRSFHNCSGKHCGFLTVCRHHGFAVQNYHLLKHPVQQMFKANLEYFTGLDGNCIHWGIDGCAFPAPALDLHHTALAMARFADPDSLDSGKAEAARQLAGALSLYPEYMSGTDNIASAIIGATAGRVLVKTGAEGYFVAAIPAEKTGIALKIADGATRASEFFIITLLDELGLLDDAAKEKLDPYLHPDIKNSLGETVGKITHA